MLAREFDDTISKMRPGVAESHLLLRLDWLTPASGKRKPNRYRAGWSSSPNVRVLVGDCREKLAELDNDSVHRLVTGPQHWKRRDYGHQQQIGLEPTPDKYVAQLVTVFREVRRVLHPEATA